jgi:hypothetical protein
VTTSDHVWVAAAVTSATVAAVTDHLAFSGVWVGIALAILGNAWLR